MSLGNFSWVTQSIFIQLHFSPQYTNIFLQIMLYVRSNNDYTLSKCEQQKQNTPHIQRIINKHLESEWRSLQANFHQSSEVLWNWHGKSRGNIFQLPAGRFLRVHTPFNALRSTETFSENSLKSDEGRHKRPTTTAHGSPESNNRLLATTNIYLSTWHYIVAHDEIESSSLLAEHNGYLWMSSKATSYMQMYRILFCKFQKSGLWMLLFFILLLQSIWNRICNVSCQYSIAMCDSHALQIEQKSSRFLLIDFPNRLNLMQWKRCDVWRVLRNATMQTTDICRVNKK